MGDYYDYNYYSLQKTGMPPYNSSNLWTCKPSMMSSPPSSVIMTSGYGTRQAMSEVGTSCGIHRLRDVTIGHPKESDSQSVAWYQRTATQAKQAIGSIPAVFAARSRPANTDKSPDLNRYNRWHPNDVDPNTTVQYLSLPTKPVSFFQADRSQTTPPSSSAGVYKHYSAEGLNRTTAMPPVNPTMLTSLPVPAAANTASVAHNEVGAVNNYIVKPQHGSDFSSPMKSELLAPVGLRPDLPLPISRASELPPASNRHDLPSPLRSELPSPGGLWHELPSPVGVRHELPSPVSCNKENKRPETSLPQTVVSSPPKQDKYVSNAGLQNLPKEAGLGRMESTSGEVQHLKRLPRTPLDVTSPDDCDELYGKINHLTKSKVQANVNTNSPPPPPSKQAPREEVRFLRELRGQQVSQGGVKSSSRPLQNNREQPTSASEEKQIKDAFRFLDDFED